MLCMIPNFWADHRVSIINGINYLNNRGNVVGLPPGPGACTRLSCADDSGIYGTYLLFLETPSTPPSPVIYESFFHSKLYIHLFHY